MCGNENFIMMEKKKFYMYTYEEMLLSTESIELYHSTY